MAKAITPWRNAGGWPLSRFEATRALAAACAPALAVDEGRITEHVPAESEAQSAWVALREMEEALARLSGEQREVVLMVALTGMSYQDCAAALGVPIGTVMSRLTRGRERLRQMLEGETPTRAEPLLRRVK